MTDLHLFSATQLKKQFLSGSVTAVEIATYFLERTRKLDPIIGAFLSVNSESIIQRAKHIDSKYKKKEKLGKLAAIPIAIKDNILVKNNPLTCASKFLTNYVAPFDASVVRFIEQEDGIIFGKTNLDEFAMGSSNEHSALKKTSNPWNINCVPGGSSGGSAAAVSARFTPISLGSDTGGSIRQPASFTGVVGFKPTYGRVSRYGLVAFGSSLDQIGPFANTVKDAALILETLISPCNRDATHNGGAPENFSRAINEPLEKMTIGVPWAFLEDLEKEQKQYFMEAITACKQIGATIVDVSLDLQKLSIPTYYILSTAEASTNLARFDGVRYGQRSTKASNLGDLYKLSRSEGFGPEVKQRILLGTYVLSSGYQDEYYKKAQKVRTLIKHEFSQAFKACSIIATPTTPSAAFKFNEKKTPLDMYLQDLYTVGSNLAGLPAISVPTGKNTTGLPNSIQFIGPQMHDSVVLQLAHHLERHLSLKNFVPTIPNI